MRDELQLFVKLMVAVSGQVLGHFMHDPGEQFRSVGVLENERRIASGTQLVPLSPRQTWNEPMDIAFGVQVARPFEGEGDVQCMEAPAGEVARTIHVGPYDRLGDAHDARLATGRSRKLRGKSTATGITIRLCLETTIKYLLA
jgi:hypothetical protein